MSNADEIIGIVVVAAVLLVGPWVFSESFPFQSEITVYNMFCTKGLENGKCNSKEETAGRVTYKPIIEKQSVVYWIEDGAPKIVNGCAIRDAKNWSCGGASDIYKSSMVNGDYSEEPSIFYAAPKWHWWQVRLTEYMEEKNK
ncbi:MAG: hypothetical protein ACYDC8_15705 [Gammaproteobacteria bacterium]